MNVAVPVAQPALAARAVSAPIRIAAAFGLIVFLNIAFQKLALPSGEYIGVPMFVAWGVLLYLWIRGAAIIDPLRVALFGMMLCAMTASLLIQREMPRGPNPVFLLLICYTAMVFRVDVDRETLLRCLNKYQMAITIVAGIVIGQQIIQFTIGNSYWPNLEKMVPRGLLIPGYMYIRPVDGFNKNWLTPNGFFFLEPSGVSEYLALGVACEIIWFKRIGRLALITFATLVAMAGTGIVILSLLSPFLFRKLDQRLRRLLIGVGLPILLIGAVGGAFSHLTDRSSELGESNSSASGRLVVPFQSTIGLMFDPSYLISGNGPGTAAKLGDLSVTDEGQWPSDKLIAEYGLLTAVFYYAFIFVTAYRFSPHPVLASVVVIPHMFFGGGFVTTTGIVALIMFCSLLRLKDPEQQSAGARR